MSIAELDFMNPVQRRNYIDEMLKEKGVKKIPISADRFLEIWSHYDKDGNLTIEEKEVDDFLQEYLTSSLAKFIEVMSPAEIQRIKRTYKEGLQANEGGRISLEYMAKLLPVELALFVLFRSESRTKTAVEFMEIWRKFDKDLSGSIDKKEFALLLEEMMRKGLPESEQVDPVKAREYAGAFLPFFDVNGDGSLSLSELARLLPSKENFVQTAIDKEFKLENLTSEDVQQLLEKYDKEKTDGTLEGMELQAFIRDILAAVQPDYSAEDVEELKKVILTACDLDKNGSIDSKELGLIIKAMATAKSIGGNTIQNFYRTSSVKK